MSQNILPARARSNVADDLTILAILIAVTFKQAQPSSPAPQRSHGGGGLALALTWPEGEEDGNNREIMVSCDLWNWSEDVVEISLSCSYLFTAFLYFSYRQYAFRKSRSEILFYHILPSSLSCKDISTGFAQGAGIFPITFMPISSQNPNNECEWWWIRIW